MDAETSPSDGGKVERNRCKASFPVYECLCAQTRGEPGPGNEMMEEDGAMKTNYEVMKAGDDDESQGGGAFGHGHVDQVFCRKAKGFLDGLCESSCPLWDGIKEQDSGCWFHTSWCSLVCLPRLFDVVLNSRNNRAV